MPFGDMPAAVASSCAPYWHADGLGRSQATRFAPVFNERKFLFDISLRERARECFTLLGEIK